MRRLLPVCAVVLSIGSGGCKQDAVTLIETPARDSDGRVMGTIPAYTRVTVRAIPFMGDDWIRVIDGPALGEVRRHTVGLLPLQTTSSWVGSVKTTLRLKDGGRTLPGCTPIATVTVTTDEGPHLVVVEEGTPVGVVGARDVATARPEAATFWAMTSSALTGLRPDDAETAAEATLTCDPAHGPARDVLAALVVLKSPARATELLARQLAPTAPLPRVASGAAFKSGELAFVVDTETALRSDPRDDMPVIVSLPIGTSVRVLDAGTTWSRVQSLVGDVVVDLGDPFAGLATGHADDADAGADEDAAPANDDDDKKGGGAHGNSPVAVAPAAAVAVAPPGTTTSDPKADAVHAKAETLERAMHDVVRTGYVQTASLAPVAPELSRLQTEAAALGATPEAVVVWQRALALDPIRDDVRKAFVEVALKAGRHGEAALAQHTPARNAGRAFLTATMQTFRGCLGDVRKATVIDGGLADADDAVGNVCVDFDPRPACLDPRCPDDLADIGCRSDGLMEDDEADADAGPPKAAAVIEAEAEAIRARDEADAAEAAADRARDEAEAAEARIALVTANEQKKAQTTALGSLFPRGPLVRLSLRRLETLPPGTTLHLARMTVGRGCGEMGEKIEDIEATFAPLPLPTPVPQGEFVVLFQGTPGQTYAVYRVAAGEPGPDSGELAERHEARLAEVLVPGTEPDCSCEAWCWR